MALSTYLRNKILDHYLGGSSFAQPTPFVSLHTADPGLTGANEVAGGSYARQNVSAKLAAASGGSKASNADTDFTGMPAVGGGGVTHIGIWDASSAGNFLQGGALAAAKVVNLGDTFRLTQPDLVISLT